MLRIKVISGNLFIYVGNQKAHKSYLLHCPRIFLPGKSSMDLRTLPLRAMFVNMRRQWEKLFQSTSVAISRCFEPQTNVPYFISATNHETSNGSEVANIRQHKMFCSHFQWYHQCRPTRNWRQRHVGRIHQQAHYSKGSFTKRSFCDNSINNHVVAFCQDIKYANLNEKSSPVIWILRYSSAICHRSTKLACACH